MKFLLAIVLALLSITLTQGDLLDDLEHHHGHDDHHHDDHGDHDEHHEHLDHHDDHIDHDDHLNDDESEIETELLREIEQFLPNQDSHGFAVPNSNNDQANFGSSFDNQLSRGSGIGVPLFSINDNQLPQVQEPQEQLSNNQFQEPEPHTNTQFQDLQQPEHQLQQLQQPESSFGLVPEQQPAISDNLVPVINNPISLDEIFDSREEALHFDVDIPDSLSSSPFSLGSAHKDADYDDINTNHIGGQGRQLDAGDASPFVPSSFALQDGEYPRYDEVPPTSFNCNDHENDGYYADTEAECQVFHICHGGGLLASFLCPNATLFNQEVFVCDWWYNVECAGAPSYYHLNARIGVVPESSEDYF